MAPPRSRGGSQAPATVVESEGALLTAVVEGEGIPVLLLHGHGFTSLSWSPVIDHLAASLRCIAPDQRGFGESGGDPDSGWDLLVDDVAAWADTCDSPPVIAGHSWGAKVGLLAASRGVACRGVFCIDGAIWNQAGGALSEDVYDLITVPVAILFASRSKQEEGEWWPYTLASVDEFARRNPKISIDWTETGHNVLAESPADLARRIEEFSRAATSV